MRSWPNWKLFNAPLPWLVGTWRYASTKLPLSAWSMATKGFDRDWQRMPCKLVTLHANFPLSTLCRTVRRTPEASVKCLSYTPTNPAWLGWPTPLYCTRSIFLNSLLYWTAVRPDLCTYYCICSICRIIRLETRGARMGLLRESVAMAEYWPSWWSPHSNRPSCSAVTFAATLSGHRLLPSWSSACHRLRTRCTPVIRCSCFVTRHIGQKATLTFNGQVPLLAVSSFEWSIWASWKLAMLW